MRPSAACLLAARAGALLIAMPASLRPPNSSSGRRASLHMRGHAWQKAAVSALPCSASRTREAAVDHCRDGRRPNQGRRRRRRELATADAD
eukprot:4904435-Pyramimonas_sp.AAC.1